MQNKLWSIGFRPFFLFGSFLSIGLVLYWAVVFFREELHVGIFDPIFWHAHEMVFGFVLAIVAGFLLTASANWTRSVPIGGNKLKIVFATWAIGRLAFLMSLFSLPINPHVYSFLDLIFLPALIFFLAPPLIRSRQTKNIQFIFILLLMMAGNVIFHLASLEYLDFIWVSRGIYLAVQLILLIMVIIGGRIIPFFTRNALPGSDPGIYSFIEIGSVASVWFYIIFDFIFPEHRFLPWVAFIAGVMNFSRLLGWQPWKTFKTPLLWILHMGYFWIVIGFLLIFLSATYELLPQSSALHAFTTGSMGTFIIGMISRVSLGHTGRPLVLPKFFIWSYVFIVASGVLRVGAGFVSDYYLHGVLCSGIFWALSYTLYLVFYSHILIAPRPDGRAV